MPPYELTLHSFEQRNIRSGHAVLRTQCSSMESSTPSSQIEQLVDLLCSHLGGAAASIRPPAVTALLDRARAEPPGTPDVNRARTAAILEQMQALVADEPESARRLHELGRLLDTAGAKGSNMAPFGDKAALLSLLLDLQCRVPHVGGIRDSGGSEYSRVPANLVAAPATATGIADTRVVSRRRPAISESALPRPASPDIAAAKLPARALVPVSLQSQALSDSDFALIGLLSQAMELVLARDALFLLQGVNGKYASFEGEGDAERVVCTEFVGSCTVPAFARAALMRVGEAGWQYRRLTRALTAPDSNAGAVHRAFRAALRDEVDDYLRQLASLSEHARGMNSDIDGHADSAAESGSWSLRRIAAWSVAPLQRLRALTSLADTCLALHGGALLGALAATVDGMKGDTAAALQGARVLAKAAAPLLSASLDWIATGELPVGCSTSSVLAAGGTQLGTGPDFFIVADESVAAAEAWDSRFGLLPSQVPAYFPPRLARAVLDIGRAVYFAREACGDGVWIAANVAPAVRRISGGVTGGHRSRGVASTADATGAGSTLVEVEHALRATVDGGDAGGVRNLERAVAAIGPTVHARLASLLLDGHKLRAHLGALHRYVLLSAGDFASALLPPLASLLDGPSAALALAVHTLDGHLESALRASLAQSREDRDILSRIYVRVLAPSPGDIGWDVFTLGYSIGPPLTAVITQAAGAAYARLCLFFTRVKRAQGALAASWTAAQSGAHGVRRLRHAGLSRVLHACALVRSDMHSLVSTLAGYLGLDVLAAGATTLEVALDTATCVEDLVAVHGSYLSGLLERSFLTERTRAVGSPLGRLLDDVLRFATVLGKLTDAAAAADTTWREHEAAVSARVTQGTSLC